MNKIQNILNSTAILAAIASTSGCFVVDALPGKKTPGGERPPVVKVEPSPTPVTNPTPKTLTGDRLLRRITVELNGKLPTTEQRAAFAADSNTLPDTIDALADTADTARTLAEAHRMMWRMSARLIPDLDRFALSNTALASALTASTKIEIVGEPFALIRKILDDQRPYSEIFQRNYTIAHSSVLTLWGYTAGAQQWSTEPYFMADFPDSRPAAGILNTQGFLAAFGSEGEVNGSSRMAAILGRIACISYEATKAHDFSSLTDEQVSGDLSALAMTEVKCAGCHAQFKQAAQATSGYGRPSNLTDWLARDTATDSATGVYAGAKFTGIAELGVEMGEDHRIKSCIVRNMMSAFMQRPFSLSSDAVQYSHLLTAFRDTDGNLRKVAAAIAKSNEFQWKPVTRTDSLDLAKRASGLRFLSRRHLIGLVQQLAPSASITIPEELDPGSEELAGTTYRNPNGTYFHYLNRFSRQLATAIVAGELATAVEPTARVILTAIPAGGAAGIDNATITAQILAAYKFLTGIEITEASLELKNLLAIYQAGGGSGTDSSSRDSWRAVLIGILLSPDFVTF